MSRLVVQKEFEPLGIYDAPGLLISSLLEDEVSFEGIKRTFLSPNSLTPFERSDLADKVLGPNADSFSKAIVGVATNPWVWLGFLTTPVGGRAVREGKSLFQVKKEYSAYVKESSGALGLMKTSLQDLDGTAAPTVALEIAQEYQRLGEASKEVTLAARQKLLAKINQNLRSDKVSSLYSKDYSKGSSEYDAVRRFEVLSAALGWSINDAVERVPSVRRSFLVKEPGQAWKPYLPGTTGKDEGVIGEAYRALGDKAKRSKKKWKQTWETLSPQEKGAYKGVDDYVEQNAFLVSPLKSRVKVRNVPAPFLGERTEIVQAIKREYGDEGLEYARTLAREEKRTFVEYLGDEAHYKNGGQFIFDEKKVQRLAASFEREIQGEGLFRDLAAGSSTLQGKEAILSLIGSVRFNKARNIKDLTRRRDFLMKSFRDVTEPGRWNDEFWTPRNVYDPVIVEVNGKKLLPTLLQGTSSFEAKNLDLAPWASSQVFTNRVSPITSKEVVFHPDDIDVLEQAGINVPLKVRSQAAKTRKKAQELYVNENGKAVLGLRLSREMSHDRYLASVHWSTTMDTQKAGAASFKADLDNLVNLKEERGQFKTKGLGGIDWEIRESLEAMPPDQKELVTRSAILDRVYAGLGPVHKTILRDELIPGALHAGGPQLLALYDSQMRTKEMANWVAESWVGKTIEKMGDPGKQMMARIREVGDWTEKPSNIDLSKGLAKWFYLTHLGMNLSSIMLNITQPLLLAASVGDLEDVVKGYGKALEEMWGYARKRVAIGGVHLDPSKKMSLIQDSFKFAGKGTKGVNLLELGPNMEHVLDWQLKFGRASAKDKIIDLIMKGFEKSEWLVRVAASHIFANRMKRVGRTIDNDPLFATDMMRFVQETQFANTPLNTPRLFKKGALSSPLLRQFFSFPLRSAVGALSVFPKLGEKGWEEGLVNLTLRQMALSAGVYEVGKAMFGVDASRGLFAASVTDVIGGSKLVEGRGQEYLPVPPVIDVPVGLLRGVAQGDADLLTNSFARMIPGGVSIVRALGAAGEAPVAIRRLGLQKEYVGWNEPDAQGAVPVYDRQGQMVTRRTPAEIAARALGVDVGKWGPGELNRYLLAQKDQISGYRKEYIRRLTSKDIQGARAIEQEFNKRFKGLPLTVTRDQINQYMTQANKTRTQRAMEKMPIAMREAYMQYESQLGDVNQDLESESFISR
jgi:hypothetical protein